MNQVILDSDTLSDFLRGNKEIAQKFEAHIRTYEFIYFTIITYYEILNGLLYKDAKKQLKTFLEFCEMNRMLILTKQSAYKSAKIFSDLRKNGKFIGHTDILIAGITLENDLTLVTNNSRHFKLVDELRIENWTQ